MRARAQTKFMCEFSPLSSSSSFSLHPSSFAPDIHHGTFWGTGEQLIKREGKDEKEGEEETATAWFSVGVQNEQSDKWIKSLIISLSPSDDVKLVESNAGDFPIAPGIHF